ncbi:MAG: AbrB/MazE/SpoVT family DNA-binding domain-containing protein [Sphingomonadales bacterium]
MNAITKVSAKGQVVIPKDVRDAMGWPQGTALEVIHGAAGVMLRVPPTKKGGALSFDESMERIHAILKYDGPRTDDADWKESIDAMFRDRKDIAG